MNFFRSKKTSNKNLEKGFLLKEESYQQNICDDERLLKLFDELYGSISYKILKHFRQTISGAFLTLIVMIFVGCGMLYGGYLLEIGILRRQGDIFIVVLSMVLISNSFINLVPQYRSIISAVSLAECICDTEAFVENNKINENRLKSKLEIESGTQQMVIIQTIFDRKVGKEEWLSTQFFRRTNQILRTHKNGRLLLILGLFTTIIHGFESPTYNVTMGKIFEAMLEPRVRMMDKLANGAIAFVTFGIIAFSAKILTMFLMTTVAKHLAITIHINLIRVHFGSNLITLCKNEINALVLQEDNLSDCIISHILDILINESLKVLTRENDQ
ncbi:unnamed protein product [Dracunculus medinensis]|uniref:ABC transmembrane type-1 domain-containing protein n=1 Tax=Dracunculus medinensis TaxID=318479 RepID=A0A0N4UMJ0_DRAME|nr:unnamed protein product [Dracunculus medinensis]